MELSEDSTFTLQLSSEDKNSFIADQQAAITTLIITGSEIDELPNRNYPSLFPSLTHFYANDLKLQSLPTIFAGPTFQHLKVLQLNGNRFKKLAEGVFTALPVLEELSLRNSLIQETNEMAFRGLSRLRVLNLEYNGITILPERLFHGLSQLFWLFFDGNQLRELNMNRFVENQKLSALLVRNNDLVDITYCNKSSKSKIKQLYLTNNRLSTVPLWMFPDLRSLDLSKNPNITIDEQTFVSNKQIQELLLFNTGLDRQEHWYRSLRPLVSLARLAIGDNRFKQLKFELFPNLKHLEYLDMKGCDLDAINVIQLKQQFPRIQKIDTNENDLNCKTLATILVDCQSANITLVNKKIQILPDRDWALCDGKMYSLNASVDGDWSQVLDVGQFAGIVVFVLILGTLIVYAIRCCLPAKKKNNIEQRRKERIKHKSVESFESFESVSIDNTLNNQESDNMHQNNEAHRMSIYWTVDNPDAVK